MSAKEHLMKTIELVKADIAMHARLLAEATTDEGRAYQQRQIEICERQLAKREAMLSAEVTRSN